MPDFAALFSKCGFLTVGFQDLGDSLSGMTLKSVQSDGQKEYALPRSHEMPNY